MNKLQKQLAEQIKTLKGMKNSEALVENLKNKINLGILYEDLTEEEVREVFDGRKTETLTEGAVCYIDNAGNLKSTSTTEYDKSQHEYDTSTEIKGLKKKAKKALTEGEEKPAEVNEVEAEKAIHVSADGATQVMTPAGEVSVNPDGTMDIALAEEDLGEFFEEGE